jgi:hypothetical protein
MKNLFSLEATQRTEHISAEVWHVEKGIEQKPYKGEAKCNFIPWLSHYNNQSNSSS